MKLAIVHDDLMRRGGAEQVARCFRNAYPEAPIYTLAYQPNKTYPDFKNSVVITSGFQNLATNENKMKKYFFPLGLIAMHLVDVTEYEVVLMSSTYCAKYVRVSPNALVINYCHQPFRLAWYPESYLEFLQANGLKKLILKKIVGILKYFDYKAAQRTNLFIANTPETADKIKSVYHFKSDIPVIYPPVNCQNFIISNQLKSYYLVVSRLEYYKRIDLVIDVFNELGLPLIVVGKGSKEDELKKSAKSNIIFKSNLNAEELQNLYANCKALVFPQLEDFGITPLEANAAGRPVIAYGAGGVLYTMLPLKEDIKRSTAIFFHKQDVKSLKTAILAMEKNYNNFDPFFIRENAKQFDEKTFVKKIQDFVQQAYQSRWALS